MAVDVAPPPLETEAAYDDDRVHSGLFWLCILAIIVGSVTIAGSRFWASRASNAVTFPVLNQSALLKGQVTFHVDPTSLAPLGAPQVQSLVDARSIQTPGLVDTRALLLTNDVLTVGNKGTRVLAQYLVDVRNVAQLRGAEAWSFEGTNVADRSRAYAVNFPFETGSGPYALWVNEVDGPVMVTQQGQPFTNDGITVIRLRGHLDPTPVDPLFIAQLARAGIPAAVTLAQLQPTLNALGADIGAAMPGLRLKVTPAENGILDNPITLDYTMSGDISLLVEPRTGTIVSVEKTAQAYTARFNPAALGAVTDLLTKYRGVPGVAGALAVLQRLGAAPQTPAFDLQAAQTPASVKTLSDYAAQQRSSFDWLKTGIPTTMLVVGIVLAAIGVLAGVMAWRHRRDDLLE